MVQSPHEKIEVFLVKTNTMENDYYIQHGFVVIQYSTHIFILCASFVYDVK
jgi:hypothetical protein